MNTSEVLNRAADLIEERGWVRGEGWPGQEVYGGADNTQLCLEGAIMAALGIDMTATLGGELRECLAYQAVHRHLELDPMRRLYTWNDHPSRTAGEVVEVLRAAAVIEAAREQDAAWLTYVAQVVQS